MRIDIESRTYLKKASSYFKSTSGSVISRLRSLPNLVRRKTGILTDVLSGGWAIIVFVFREYNGFVISKFNELSLVKIKAPCG
jgi:hypothetical protein